MDGAGAMPFQLIIALSIVFFIGVMGQPTMLAKMYSVKTPQGSQDGRHPRRGSYGALSLVWILVGYGAIYLVATGAAPAIKDLDKAAFLFVSKTNGVLQALIMAALLAAIVSTASFFISLASGALTRDLAGSFGHEVPVEKQIIMGRYLQIVVMILCIGFGYWGGRAVAILGTLGWGFFASVTLPTFVMGLLWRRCSREGVIVGLTFAVIANIALPIMENFKIVQTPLPLLSPLYRGGHHPDYGGLLFTSGAAGENLPKELKPIFKL